ncbi:DUF3987 domain-containing protein [Ruegeria sp. AD91A]|uniref:DUF3987 domain-containing protein n=1 Tax=Ruegeria sp. AD91A TaxID=2293862 RepID=UPI000E53ABA0|nr:DUF3987 domain-containing protein [Ruegeria sp. AD91A]AXT25535.1 DUF3987 domain-containing protein [Ruegeria sp. AD91A]
MMIANGAYAPGAKVEGAMLPPGAYEPVDLWGQFDPPGLDVSLLPTALQMWVKVQAYRMGADPAGLGVAALVACAAAIPDQITIKVKRYEEWTESARLWAALVGLPSTGKSPIISAATRPLKKLDNDMFRAWRQEVQQWNDAPKDERGPPVMQRRLVLQDTTVEAAQAVLEGSPWGVMMLQDELSGFFGAMDKYGGKGGSADRGFWLQSWNGGVYSINRVGRGSNQVPNLSVSLLGGIQPEPIRKLAADAQDDGLLQRLFPIVLKPKSPGVDEPTQDVDTHYRQLIGWLRGQGLPLGMPEAVLHFDDGAQQIRRELEQKHYDLQSLESVSPKLAAHVGKYDAMFPRLCLTYHMIEAGRIDQPITADTAHRVSRLLHEFLFRHAAVFYSGVLGLSDEHDRLKNIAAFILAHRLDCISNRDVQRGDRAMRKIDNRDIQPLLEQLHTLGWLDSAVFTKVGVPPLWVVNPTVHVMFAERGQREAERRELEKTTIQQALR